MKKSILILIVITLGGLLSACGQASANAGTENAAVVSQNESNISTDGTVPQGTREPGSNQLEMPMQTMLILGTFRLEDTDLAIQAEQAKVFLPLWQVLNNLLESDTVAAEEIDALVNQIADTMTGEQMQAIQAMGLTMQDLATLTADLGLDESFQGPEDLPAGESGFQRPEGMPEGVRPGGGQGMGPGGGAGGVDLSPEELESLRATRQAEGGGLGRRGGGMWNTALIEALIELLQSK